MNSLIQRASVSSIEEIERVISGLQAMRDPFRTEAIASSAPPPIMRA
jgi:hypothetical protein